MPKTSLHETCVSRDCLPSGILCTSFTGHVFEISVNSCNGKVLVRYPNDRDTLRVLSEVFADLFASGFLPDLINTPDYVFESRPSVVIAPDEHEADELENARYYLDWLFGAGDGAKCAA